MIPHLKQKLYKEGKDFIMARWRAQAKARPSPTTTSKVLKGESPRIKTRTSVRNVEKEPISKDINAQQLIRSVDSARKKEHYKVLCRKKKCTVHQVSAEPSTTTMTVYTSEDGTVTYNPTYHIRMISTVSLIKPQVIDDDDGTPEDIFISMPMGDEHMQDKKVNVKIDTGPGRNVMSIKTLKELFGENVKISPLRIPVRAYGNFDIKVLGCYLT